MKKLAILLFISLSLYGYSQGSQVVKEAKADKRAELLGIVFRLAGNSEYNNTRFKLYADKIDQHFATYKKHKLIAFAEKLRKEKGISHDAVLSMAIHLDDKLNPRVEFGKSSLDKRWSKDDATMFVKLLQQFYTEAKCEEFFNDNERLYHEATIRFLHVYDFIDFDWYVSFYGEKPSEKFNISLALGVGDTIYNVEYQNEISGEREVCLFLGAGGTDNTGMVEYDSNINLYYTTLVHEFGHSFVDALMDKHKELFRVNGEKIFKLLEPEMRIQGFDNWETMLDEAFVRASVVKYLKDHDFEQAMIESLLQFELTNSFLWIKPLVDELEKYDSQRNNYPTISGFIPALAQLYNTFTEMIVKYNAQKPIVESISEFANGDQNVSYSLKTITFNFSRPLERHGYSIIFGEKGEQAFPTIKNVSYANDNKSVKIEVQLLPEKEYQFLLTGENFRSPEGFALKLYEVNFKTSK
jgi:hypothetical protein